MFTWEVELHILFHDGTTQDETYQRQSNNADWLLYEVYKTHPQLIASGIREVQIKIKNLDIQE